MQRGSRGRMKTALIILYTLVFGFIIGLIDYLLFVKLNRWLNRNNEINKELRWFSYIPAALIELGCFLIGVWFALNNLK
jgi:hypothetical protein